MDRMIAEQRRRTEELRSFKKKFKRAKRFLHRLELLRKMATLKFQVSLDLNITRKLKREEFDNIKGIAFKLKKKCQVCNWDWATIRHHVIQIKNGGSNRQDNIVSVCVWCHQMIHPWMEAPEPKPESMSETFARLEREA